jgi:RNA polymerase sigma-70 factor (ECF subfamily)
LCKVQKRSYEQAAFELRLSKHTVKEYLSGAVEFHKRLHKTTPTSAWLISHHFAHDGELAKKVEYNARV